METLHDMIYNNEIALFKKITFTRCITSGLNYLHSISILHRDIKPPNILITSDKSRAIIYNFSNSTSGINVQSSDIVGTPYYLAPEICTSKKYSEASDIYALGITSWEIFEQQRPYANMGSEFNIQTGWQAVENYIHERAHRPSFTDFTPLVVRKIIESLWHKDPEYRQQLKLTDILKQISDIPNV